MAKMNHIRPKQTSILSLLLTICVILASCEMQVDQEVLEDSVTENFDLQLNEALEIMSDEPDVAIQLLEEVITSAKKQSSNLITGKALWYKAYVHDKILEDVSKAYFDYNESLKYLRETEDFELRAKVSNNLAILNQYYGHHDAAIDLYNIVLGYQDELSDEFVSDIYFNIGRSFKLKRDDASLKNAEESFTMSMEFAKRADYHENIASVNNQVGTMYKDLKNYDMARIAYRNTIRSYQNETNKELLDYVGKAYHGIGVTYMEEKDFDEAISSFKTALNFEQNSGTIFITKYDLGSVLNEAGKTMEAVATWKEALQERHNKNDRVHLEIYTRLTSTLASQNEFKEAVKYAQIYNEHISNILSVGENYESENNQVIFADIVREYAEFNQVIPFYKKPWAIVLMFILIALAVYSGSSAYYQSKLSTKVSDTRSEIQIEFQNIKLD